MSSYSISFYIKKYYFNLIIKKQAGIDNHSKLSVLRLKRLLVKNSYLKKFLKNKIGKTKILFPTGSSIIDENLIINILKFYSDKDITFKTVGEHQNSTQFSYNEFRK